MPRLRTLVIAVALGIFSGTASSQEFPSRPIALIAPFSPGGITDVLARVVAERMSQELKSPVIVENRPGAGAVIGTAAVAKAVPDGYTLLFYGGSTLTPEFRKDLPFDIRKDFAPVGLVFQGSLLLIVNGKGPYKTLPEFVAYARKNPDKLNFGTTGSLTQVAGEVVMKGGDFKMTSVLYKSSADVSTAMLRGDLDVTIDIIQPFEATLASGGVRALAVLGPNRIAALPDVPSSAELGMPQLRAVSTGGIWAPAGTPQSTIQKLNAVLNKALDRPEIQDRIRKSGLAPAKGSPEDYRKAIFAESDFWSQAARDAHLQPQ